MSISCATRICAHAVVIVCHCDRSRQRQPQHRIPMQASAPALQPRMHATSSPAVTAAPSVPQELQSLVSGFLDLKPLVEPAADDQREAETDAKPAASSPGVDPLPVAISLCYRICVMVLDRAPSAMESQARARMLFLPAAPASASPSLVRHTVDWLDSAIKSGHQLSYLFVRLLTLCVTGQPAEAISGLIRAPASGSSAPPAPSFLQLLSGMLRLSEATWLLRECIEIMATVMGVTEIQLLMQTHSGSAQHQLARKQARASFVAAFLAPSGRSILTLVKHISHEGLSEETRSTLLRTVVAIASTPSAGAQQPSPSILARRMLASQRDKWSERLLPSLQTDSEQQEQLRKHRRAQILSIRELAVIVDLTAESASKSVAASAPSAAAPAKRAMVSRMPMTIPASQDAAAAPPAHAASNAAMYAAFASRR